MDYTHTLTCVHLICTPMDSGGHAISDRVSILMRMHCCTVHTPCYGIKHLNESLSYIDMLLHLMVQNVYCY